MNHLGTKIIETERLILRPFALEDAETMYRNWASDPEVTKYLTWPTHENIQVTQWVLNRWTGQYDKPDYYHWVLEWKEIGEPIGSLAAVKINDSTQQVEIGYCIGRNWWHRGITAEALGAVIRFFFREVGMNRIQALHDPRNPNSGAVMRKCGMRYEGTLRQAGRNNQGICDEAVYSILREEYDVDK